MLTLPLAEGQGTLAMLAFLGGFSSATSMVIVESIALATMISNHVMIPLWLIDALTQSVMGETPAAWLALLFGSFNGFLTLIVCCLALFVLQIWFTVKSVFGLIALIQAKPVP